MPLTNAENKNKNHRLVSTLYLLDSFKVNYRIPTEYTHMQVVEWVKSETKFANHEIYYQYYIISTQYFKDIHIVDGRYIKFYPTTDLLENPTISQCFMRQRPQTTLLLSVDICTYHKN
jgi:hypothetical protein